MENQPKKPPFVPPVTDFTPKQDMQLLAKELEMPIDEIMSAAKQTDRIEKLISENGLTRKGAIGSIAMEDSWLTE